MIFWAPSFQKGSGLVNEFNLDQTKTKCKHMVGSDLPYECD